MAENANLTKMAEKLSNDPFLGFLIRLDHLRRGIERAVPQARVFVRPGLDEPPVSFHTS